MTWLRDHWPFLLIGACLMWVLMGGSFGSLTAGKDRQVKAEGQTREAVVIQTLKVGEAETVKILNVPDPVLTDPVFDTRCVIYVNEQLGKTTTTCIGRPSPN